MATDIERMERWMGQIPKELPEEVDQWIEDVCLENHHYIVYDKKKNRAFCSHCKKMIDGRLLVPMQASHNQNGKCPACGFKITYICAGRFKKETMRSDTFQIRVMQRVPDGIVIRRFELIRNLKHNVYEFATTDTMWTELQRVCNNGDRAINYRHFWFWDEKERKHKQCWIESRKMDYTCSSSMGYTREIAQFDFQENIKTVLANSPLKYAKSNKSLDYYSGWIRQCEYTEKMKMESLTQDLIWGKRKGLNFKAASMEKFLRIPKNQIKQAIENDYDIESLDNLRYLLNNKFRNINSIMVKQLTMIRSMYTGIMERYPTANLFGIERFMEYCSKQDSGIRYGYYADYLGFCEKLGYDLKSENVVYPKDLVEAHDREMKRVQIKENAAKSQGIIKRYFPDMKKHGFETDTLLIRPPRDFAEIVKEGSTLNHCVGSYAELVSQGKTTILFVRLKSDPEKPFYTVEWRDGKTVQIRGHRNASPTPEVAEFMREWESRHKRKQKIKIAV